MAEQKYDGFDAEERAAMKERAKELKAQKRPRGGKADGEADLLAKVAEMEDSDRMIAEKLHAIVQAVAPELGAKTWYGMPAYTSGGKVLCFFQPAKKFGTRYATLGFNDIANLDDGTMFPTVWAITEMNAASEARIAELIRQAVS